MIDALIRKLQQRDTLSDEECAALRSAMSETRKFANRQVIVREDVPLTTSNLVLDGFVVRYKDMPDGRRQIFQIHVPGDFVDLHGFILKRLEHNIGAIGPVTIAIFPHEGLRSITERHPHLTRMLWFSTLLDASLHREQILNIGRRSALERVAHLLSELDARLGLVLPAGGDRWPMPLTQADFGDATGLTPVHVNRMLQDLRIRGLAIMRDRILHIVDRAGLQRVGGFDSAYLHLDHQPR